MFAVCLWLISTVFLTDPFQFLSRPHQRAGFQDNKVGLLSYRIVLSYLVSSALWKIAILIVSKQMPFPKAPLSTLNHQVVIDGYRLFLRFIMNEM